MKNDYFKFNEGKVIHYDKQKSFGIIDSKEFGDVCFFLSDLSKISKNPIKNLKVSFSQIEKKKDNQLWANVIVEESKE